jgi:predicted MFS family arabinose efflux permease
VVGGRPTPAAGGRVLAALCVSAFLASLNFFATTPFYVPMARDLHTTVPLLGQVVTLMNLLSAGLGLVVGPLGDRYGYRWPLVIGLLAIAVNLLGTGLAPAYPVLLGLSAAGGLGDALVFGLALAIAGTRFEGDARRRAIGWTIGALSIAPIVGAPLLTAIGGVGGWRAALAAGGLAAVGAAWLVAAALPPDGRRPTTPLQVRALLEAYAPLLRHPATLRLFGVVTLRAAWFLALLTYLGAFLGEAVGLSTRQIGFFYTLAGGGYAAGSLVAGGRLGAVSPRASVVVSSVAGGLLVGPMLWLASAWVALPLLLLLGLAASVCNVGAAALLAAESPAGAGTTMVLTGSLINAGAAGGAALGGVLIALGGYGALGIGLPLLAFAAAALAWWPAAAGPAPPPAPRAVAGAR